MLISAIGYLADWHQAFVSSFLIGWLVTLILLIRRSSNCKISYGNSELTTEIDHQTALQRAVRDVSTLIASSFGDKTSTLTLVCVPAATPENTERRFKTFSERVCEECQIENGYGHWEEADYLKDKDVILFDDIIASGKSVAKYADKLTSLGANVVAAIALGKTV